MLYSITGTRYSHHLVVFFLWSRYYLQTHIQQQECGTEPTCVTVIYTSSSGLESYMNTDFHCCYAVHLGLVSYCIWSMPLALGLPKDLKDEVKCIQKILEEDKNNEWKSWGFPNTTSKIVLTQNIISLVHRIIIKTAVGGISWASEFNNKHCFTGAL